MADFKGLTDIQINIAAEITQLAENFRKERIERRTIEGTTSYSERLKDSWAKFEETHALLEDEREANSDHPYFSQNYYQQVYKEYNELLVKIEERMVQITNASTASTHKPSEGTQKANQPASTKDNLEQLKLKNQLEGTISALDRVINAIEKEMVNPQSKAYYIQKLKFANQYWDQISLLHGQIMADISDEHYNVRAYSIIEDRFQTIAIKLQEKLDEQTISLGGNGNVKLPKITLPTFDGVYTKWTQFKELFTQLIHNRPLSGAEKMFYLKANLIAEPNRLIKHLQATEDNYTMAWKILIERYDNPRTIVTAILNDLLSQQSLMTETTSGIKRLHDCTKECLLALEKLGIRISDWSPILLHLLLQKIDKESRRLYEQSLKSPRELQDISDFLKFLESRFQMLEAVHTKEERKKTSTFTASAQATQCPVCKADHKIYKCTKFLYLPLENRIRLVRQLHLCPNCLRLGHKARDCSSSSCKKCNKNHNTLIHDPELERAKSSQRHANVTSSASSNDPRKSTLPLGRKPVSDHKPNEITQNTTQSVSSATNMSQMSSKGSQVMLATAVIRVISASGTPVNCRVLLDSGSQLHFVCERLVQTLGLQRRRISLPISGIGGLETNARYETSLTIQSRLNDFSTGINAVILKTITEQQPSMYIKTSSWNIPNNIQLADPAFHKPQSIDMLLGAELFLQLLEEGQIRLHNDLPLLQNTRLGWILSGRIQEETRSKHSCYIATQPSVTALERQLQQFWEVENHDSPSRYMSREELECEEHFQTSVQRSTSGRYTVKLPFREKPSTLGSSFDIAAKRFFALERKLYKNEDTRTQYIEFMKEYEALGHMQPIARELIPPIHYYMPHHCVTKADSTTTKLRVVFDASAKTTSGKSLNDILMVGPTVQPDLFSILSKFRIHKYVLTADICKMYRQIELHPNDKGFQLILWRDSKEKPLQTYQLNTVTYGTAAAPFLATRSLNQLALAEYDSYPEAANVILGSTYVDDILTGSSSTQDLIKLKDDLIRLLRSGGFELRKFSTNHAEILQTVPEDHKEKMLVINETEVTKALGLVWEPNKDTFQYQITEYKPDKLTKRTVLSDITRIFDPLGLIGPVTVLGKLFVQELFKDKCSWDEELPIQYREKWIKFKKRLSELKTLKIPRHVILSKPLDVQLHAFSDSSEYAYGACCYLRSSDYHGQIRVRLLCAKSRIAPLKTMTLARLELCAALLMAELTERVCQCLSVKLSKIVYYTDSTIVLSWISSPSYTWTTFVANRVEKIQQLTQTNQWRHIDGAQNPADIISRGMLPDALMQSGLWFKGPAFLANPEVNWPKSSFKSPDRVPETKTKKSALTIGMKEHEYTDMLQSVNHSNSFLKMQRIFAYCIRFTQNCKTPRESRNTGELSITELDKALSGIIKNVQRSALYRQYLELKKNKALDPSNPIQHLTPYLDQTTQIIKVGGRLKHSDLAQEAKNQILLPKGHKFNDLLFDHLHKQHMHVAPQTLIAIARQRYWVIDARRLAQKTVHRCIRCFRCKPKALEQIMGDLPKERVRTSTPFHKTGVDFCGPIMIHFKVRGKSPTKAYIAVFVCFTTKAVHMELASDLSAEAFLNALKRFIARRGLCATIFCDNATNFLGARTQLKELKDMFTSQKLQSSLSQLCAQNHIEWKPIPPRSPHFGGLWEAAVKSAKNHLTRQVGNANLTYEELHTIIVQVEAILNSRPLTPMSADPNDFEALTPGHFLTGKPLTTFAETDISDQKVNNLTRYRQIQHIQQTFWNRWSAEYLQELQTRNKWKGAKPNLKPGTLVLMKDKNLPPLKWPLGRVVETFDGTDNLTRVVNVKTASGILKRSIHNLCPLPEEEHHSDCNSIEERGSNSPTDKVTESTCLLSSKQTLVKTSGDIESKQAAKRPKRPYHPLRGRFLPINSNWANSDFVKRKKKPKITEASEDNTTHSTKQVNTSTSIKLLMLTSLILPILGHPMKEPVKADPFTSHPGIFFETIGQAQLINSEWNLITYYNLDNYWNELRGIRNCIGEIGNLCNTTTIRRNHCLEIFSQFQHQLTHIEEANEILHNRSSGRRKRAPLEIVGSVANTLFGILDASYAEHIEKEIERSRKNENHLLDLLRNQTSILESTTNILKRKDESIQHQFKAIQDHIQAYSRHVDNLQHEKEATQAFTALSLLTSLILQNYQRMQDALLSVLIDLHHSKISPLLITPTQLRQQLTIIRQHLPSTLSIPGSDPDDGLTVYNIMSAATRVTDSYILFDIRIPLQHDEYFQLFKLIPVPIPHDTGFLLIKPSSEYLIVSLPRDRYYPLTQRELDSCKQLNGEKYLCHQHHPIFNLKANISQCEMNLLNHQNSLSDCQLRSSNRSSVWIQLHTPNNWLYCMDTETTFNIVCGTQVMQITLKGSGILQLRADCSMKQSSMTITGHGRYLSKVVSSFIPRMNLSDFSRSHKHTPEGYAAPELHLQSNDRELDALTNQLQDLKEKAVFQQGATLHDVHHYTISYVLLCALLAGCSYYTYSRCKHTRKQLSITPPIPAARSHTAINEDFVLHRNPRGQDDQSAKI